jgi:hypothetical protein
MKTPVSKQSPETTDAQKLDAPLSCRAFFLGISYLASAIATEGALNRQEIEHVPQEGLDVVAGYAGLCLALIKATDPSSQLGSKIEREMLLRKFNQSLS